MANCKILKQQGKNSEALASYRQAVNELWSPSLRYDFGYTVLHFDSKLVIYFLNS